MADAFRTRVGQHKYELGLSTADAAAKAEEPCTLSRMWAIEDCRPEEVTYEALEELSRKCPERALRRFEEVKQAAREELLSGDRAALAVAVQGNGPSLPLGACPVPRPPRGTGRWVAATNGIERQLLDKLAQAQAAMNFWLERLDAGYPDEQVGAMVDRFDRIFHRALRSLANLRKVPLAVVVQNAEQVNVGEQQVNVAVVRRGRKRGSAGTAGKASPAHVGTTRRWM
jgi:hypothetical protein